MGTPRPRRATSADTAAIAALSPAIIPTESDDRAVFVIDGETGPVAAIDLRQLADHINVEHLVGDRRQSRILLAHAARAARVMGLSELRWPGFREGRRRIRNGPWQRASDHLDDHGVPLWHDGTASLPHTLYFRGTWAALALLIGLGSISLVVFGEVEITLALIVIPALLCASAVVFAIVQISLVAFAALRVGGRPAFTATTAAAAAAVLAIGALVSDRAVPALLALWEIYDGDVAMNDLAVRVSADGSTLYIEGTYGMGGEEAVHRALQQNAGIQTVVLAGPGGRQGVAHALYRMFRERKLATRVDDFCLSACTIAFLGGVDRSISPGGRLGFHSSWFPGMSASDLFEDNRDSRRFLIEVAKVTPQFADRVFAVPAEDMWYPTPQELLAARVINRVHQ